MLAPTRELVAELNRRARDHRLDHSEATAEVRLADGNQASVGDVIITRSNDRRLRLTATDWVKNGDRWTITRIGPRGDLTVRHTRSQLTVRLPIDYVGTSTGLGYATTIHSAQGVSADTMHGLLTGQESRQQLYTMLTRGRAASYLYLQVVGDGDPHTIIRPDTIAATAQHAGAAQQAVILGEDLSESRRCCGSGAISHRDSPRLRRLSGQSVHHAIQARRSTQPCCRRCCTATLGSAVGRPSCSQDEARCTGRLADTICTRCDQPITARDRLIWGALEADRRKSPATSTPRSPLPIRPRGRVRATAAAAANRLRVARRVRWTVGSGTSRQRWSNRCSGRWRGRVRC